MVLPTALSAIVAVGLLTPRILTTPALVAGRRMSTLVMDGGRMFTLTDIPLGKVCSYLFHSTRIATAWAPKSRRGCAATPCSRRDSQCWFRAGETATPGLAQACLAHTACAGWNCQPQIQAYGRAVGGSRRTLQHPLWPERRVAGRARHLHKGVRVTCCDDRRPCFKPGPAPMVPLPCGASYPPIAPPGVPSGRARGREGGRHFALHHPVDHGAAARRWPRVYGCVIWRSHRVASESVRRLKGKNIRRGAALEARLRPGSTWGGVGTRERPGAAYLLLQILFLSCADRTLFWLAHAMVTACTRQWHTWRVCSRDIVNGPESHPPGPAVGVNSS